MAKVLVERPRLRRPPRGQGSPYPRAQLANLFERDFESAPSRLGMAALHRDKWLNENLAPLRRFLGAHVGRPWSAVYSEITAHVRVTSAVQAHIKQHLDDYVATSVVLVDGVPHGHRYGPLQPLATRSWRCPFYVCPRSGLLRRTPQMAVRKERFGRFIRLDSVNELREVDGVWRHVTLARRPTVVKPGRLFDVLLGDYLDPAWFDENTRRFYLTFRRTDAYAVDTRDPGRRERARIDALGSKTKRRNGQLTR